MPPDLPPPMLEVYYSSTCAPCRLEFPMLAELAADPGSRLRIVILDHEERARSELKRVSPRLDAVAVGPTTVSPRDTLRAAGNERQILPWARSLTPQGEACATWSGILTRSRARSLIMACARRLTSPGRSPS